MRNCPDSGLDLCNSDENNTTKIDMGDNSDENNAKIDLVCKSDENTNSPRKTFKEDEIQIVNSADDSSSNVEKC